MSGDYQLEDTIYLPFTTRAFATGIPTALVSGVVDIYEDVTATPIVTAETLTVSLNGHAGFNMITVTATAASGFEAGKSYTAILDAGTVDSVSVIGEVVAHFTLDKSAAAKDLANATDGLGAIKAETALIVADTNELQTDDVPGLIATAQADLDIITGAAGAIVDTGAATATAISDAVWDEDATGHQTQGTFGQAIGDPVADTTTIYQAVATDAAGDNVAIDVAAVKAETALIVADTNELQTDDVPGLIATAQADLDIITGAAGAIVDTGAATATAISDAVWDEDATGHQTTGTFGQAIGDPVANTETIYDAVVTDAAGTNVAADIIVVQSDTDDIQTRLPAALVGGAMNSDVSAMQAGVVTAAAIDTNAVDADALATDAVNEIARAILPQTNQALPNLEFLMVDNTDHVTPETGLTVTGQRSIDGGAFVAVSGTIAEVGNGIYQFDAAAADVNGTIITFRFSATGADDTFLTVRMAA